jgi:hypothetical protein
MHLAAAALHTVLGCPEACHTHVRALDIKHIQLDSVAGHMLLPALVAYTATMDGSTPQLNTGSGSSLQRLLREVTTLFTDHFKDAGDTIAMGFTNGNYSQVSQHARNSDSSHCPILQTVSYSFKKCCTVPTVVHPGTRFCSLLGQAVLLPHPGYSEE